MRQAHHLIIRLRQYNVTYRVIRRKFDFRAKSPIVRLD